VQKFARQQENKRKRSRGVASPPTKRVRMNPASNPVPSEDSSVAARKKKKQQPVRIFYTTRTHSQISKAVKELEKTEYRPIMSILGSRKQYCVHPKVSKLVNRDSEWYL
jgi:hypothetical protein